MTKTWFIVLAREEQAAHRAFQSHFSACPACQDGTECSTGAKLHAAHLSARIAYDHALDELSTDKPCSIQYGKYLIEEKRDFGNQFHWIDGAPVEHGYVVVLDHCNAMPGATWFQTVAEAKLACDILDSAGPDEFWTRWKLLRDTDRLVALGSDPRL